LLTDPAEGGLNGATLTRIAQRGIIHGLRGLHAKIYIVDDTALVTSANLTGTAFSRRYEIGEWRNGECAAKVIDLYEDWWLNDSRRVSLESILELTKNRSSTLGENGRDALIVLNSLPPDTGDFGGHRQINLFLDYPAFLDDYKDFAAIYFSVQRIRSHMPRYFETDSFLNYLFRVHENRPSKRFVEGPPRFLSTSERHKEIRHWAGEFRRHVELTGRSPDWRSTHSRIVRRLLSRESLSSLTKSQVSEIIKGLNCMNDGRQQSRFLNSPVNTLSAIRESWSELIYGLQPLTERMSVCAGNLFSFKRSSVQELLGFIDPEKYPLRNLTVNAGLRLFGYDVSAN
jgi:hypothetical protein